MNQSSLGVRLEQMSLARYVSPWIARDFAEIVVLDCEISLAALISENYRMF